MRACYRAGVAARGTDAAALGMPDGGKSSTKTQLKDRPRARAPGRATRAPPGRAARARDGAGRARGRRGGPRALLMCI